MEQKSRKRIKIYGIAIAIPLAVGAGSALLTRNNMDLYATVVTPPLAPPAVLFPIVWTILYILMGVSSAMIWQARREMPQAACTGLTYYGYSLVFNFFWSIFFFNFRRFFFAFVWLLALLYLIVRTVLFYGKVSATAAKLQIPYLLWVTFAGYLNFGIWYLN